MNSRKGLLIVCLAALASAIGCTDRELRPLNPCTLSSVSNEVAPTNIDKVDLLFMIDNSNSMTSEQALLRQQFPKMITGLLNGDPDNDPSNNPGGVAPFPKVASLRIGVVTSDMGVNGQRPQIVVGPTTLDGLVSCGLRQNAEIAFTGTFQNMSNIVTNVKVVRTNITSRTQSSTLSAADLKMLVERGRIPAYVPSANLFVENMTPPPVPVDTTITAYDAAAGTLTLSNQATADVTRTFVEDSGNHFHVPRANYGDDGILNRGLSARDGLGNPILNPGTGAPIDCDADNDGVDDILAASAVPAFLTFTQGPGADQNAYLDRVACVTNVGADGCGFEQQLESVLKAITPKTVTPTGGAFYAAPGDPNGAFGHADDPAANAGWIRDNALLAIVYVSDEEDCSAKNPDVFNPNAAGTADPNPFGTINTRCARHPEFLHTAQRYVDGILATKEDKSQIVFAAITGIPLDLVDDPFTASEGISNLDAILADPRMQPVYFSTDPSDTDQDSLVRFACVRDRDTPANDRPTPAADGTSTDNGGISSVDTAAAPGRRVVEVARGIQDTSKGEAAVLVQSICEASFDNAIQEILQLISEKLGASCLPRALNRASTGLVGCNVLITLAPGETCDALPGNDDSQPTPFRTVTDDLGTHQVCVLKQLDASSLTIPTGDGWYYDDFTSEADKCGARQPQRVNYTMGSSPQTGQRANIECLQTITGGGLAADINKGCSGAATACDMTLTQRQQFCLRYNLSSSAHPGCDDVALANPLYCESTSNTCQIKCGTDADCPGGFRCFAASGNPDDIGKGNDICVNPTCNTQIQ